MPKSQTQRIRELLESIPDEDVRVRATITLRRDQKMKLRMYQQALSSAHGRRITQDQLIRVIIDEFFDRTTYERRD